MTSDSVVFDFLLAMGEEILSFNEFIGNTIDREDLSYLIDIFKKLNIK